MYVFITRTAPLWEYDPVNHMDDTISGFDIHCDDVGRAAICIGEHTAILKEKAAVQSADTAGRKYFAGVAVAAGYVVQQHLSNERLIAQQLFGSYTEFAKQGYEGRVGGGEDGKLPSAAEGLEHSRVSGLQGRN